jgi:hypothetical protein
LPGFSLSVAHAPRILLREERRHPFRSRAEQV